ncbi:hypothetical protein [Fusobacterium nucleatum]|uniref:hypothetical protein n=1 Tax=Fusobacterium nucleatum TaxID=851 RepID=UPI0003B84856|nr:hypothetical protein [Fusobacterium nucleatum]ERT43379.1 hypothetical protein HMPREF1539_00885 [Fusobacterium nucleatum CTI-2]
MRKIVNKNSTYFYSYTGLISLIFFEIILLIFLYIFSREIVPAIAMLVPNYFFIRAIIIVLKYFISIEECYCIEDKFYYKKILWNRWILREFEIPVHEIKEIQDNGKLILRSELKEASVGYLLYYFNPYERICIETISGKSYNIWNYKKRPSYWSMDNLYEDDREFLDYLFSIRAMVSDRKKEIFFNQKIENLMGKYNSLLDERYNYILNKIIDEKKLFISEKDNDFIINGDSEAIKNLEIFKNMNFKEIDFYIFYVNYLSKKEYENKKVLVGYNGIDGKEITMLKLKEDINEIRDSGSTFKN